MDFLIYAHNTVIYIYIYIYIERERENVFVSVCVCVCVCVYVASATDIMKNQNILQNEFIRNDDTKEQEITCHLSNQCFQSKQIN